MRQGDMLHRPPTEIRELTCESPGIPKVRPRYSNVDPEFEVAMLVLIADYGNILTPSLSSPFDFIHALIARVFPRFATVCQVRVVPRQVPTAVSVTRGRI